MWQKECERRQQARAVRHRAQAEAEKDRERRRQEERATRQVVVTPVLPEELLARPKRKLPVIPIKANQEALPVLSAPQTPMIEVLAEENHQDEISEDEDALHIDESTFVNFDDDLASLSKEQEEELLS